MKKKNSDKDAELYGYFVILLMFFIVAALFGFIDDYIGGILGTMSLLVATKIFKLFSEKISGDEDDY